MEELVKKIMNIEKQAAEKLEFEKKKYADPAADAEKILVQKKIEAQAKAQERISAINAEEEAEEADKIKTLNDFSKISINDGIIILESP